jgi:pimeloyl-ACP methyl ester carboxylesterase
MLPFLQLPKWPMSPVGSNRSATATPSSPGAAGTDAEGLDGLSRVSQRLDTIAGGTSEQLLLLGTLAIDRAERTRKLHWTGLTCRMGELGGIATGLAGAHAPEAFGAWYVDFLQRWILFLDVLRERGNSYVEREREGFKPVLVFDYDVILDGRKFERPVNYALVRIRPPAGYPEQREEGRPFVIIDPRAGHGSGIGGYKSDSEVGVALRDGHPVYFVIFFTHPEPSQTLADVCAAEAVFLEEVHRRHPDAPKPLVLGNCQGGWAAMILAATHPDAPGPVVIAGAPLSYWAGERGKNPMRYLGGLVGGALPVLIASDLGDGRFDGANLVLNFEHLNPGNNWWRKYYHVLANIDTEAPRYLEFERWWSGFYFMNEAEIRWIVENLFVGNKLTRGAAILDDGTPIDLRRIKSPIVVFASHGDNITPPQQALYWIADLYRNTDEIAAAGQVIVYTLHESVGHLGIFVSSSVARKQHKQITSVVKTIEALAPGLYEMVIAIRDGGYHVSFEQRSIENILVYGDNREDEKEFAAIARLSEWATECYEMTLRPLMQSLVTPAAAEAMVRYHPLRQRRYFFSDSNPWLSGFGVLAKGVRTQRLPVPPENPFFRLETLGAELIEEGWNFYRDLRDATFELTFHALYGAWWMKELAKKPPGRSVQHDVRQFPEVKAAIERVESGGYAEAVIRMLILMAHARGSVRRSRLERSNRILLSREPFASMLPGERSHVIHEQTMIVDFAPMEARMTLPKLLPEPADRQTAIDLILEVAGPVDEMNPPTIAMFEQLQFILQVQAAGWKAPDHKVEHHGMASKPVVPPDSIKLEQPKAAE